MDHKHDNKSVLLQNTSLFVNRLLKSFIGRTEIRQYVEQLFGGVYNKIYNFRAIPEEKKIAAVKPEQKSQTENSKNFYIDPVLPQEEGKTCKTMLVEELLGFCDEAIESITSQLRCMPMSMRYLLKIIELQADKTVCSIFNTRHRLKNIRIRKARLEE